VDVIVLAQVRKLLVRLIRQWQLTLAAVGRVVLIVLADRVLLPAISTADKVALSDGFRRFW